MSLEVRRATAGDAEACARIINAWIDTTPWMPRAVSAETIEQALRDGLPKREAYVAGDPVAGYLSMDPEENHIWGLYVEKPGHGVGKVLMAAAKAGRTFLKLNTHAANHEAHRFYRREGFVPVGKPWQGNDGIDEIAMEWRS